MNIDVRDIKGKVLENMNILLKDFSSTAKATRYVIERHFDLKKTIANQDIEIKKLQNKIRELENQAKEDNEFRKLLHSFINKKS